MTDVYFRSFFPKWLTTWFLKKFAHFLFHFIHWGWWRQYWYHICTRSTSCKIKKFNAWKNCKDKSPEVPFHGITSPYSYFEVIWIFVPIQQEAKHDQEKISAELKWRVCWQSPAIFCLFTHQAKIQICVQLSCFLETYLIWATFTNWQKRTKSATLFFRQNDGG